LHKYIFLSPKKKLENYSIKDHPVVENLAKLRAMIDQFKTIDEIVEKQIDEILVDETNDNYDDISGESNDEVNELKIDGPKENVHESNESYDEINSNDEEHINEKKEVESEQNEDINEYRTLSNNKVAKRSLPMEDDRPTKKQKTSYSEPIETEVDKPVEETGVDKSDDDEEEHEYYMQLLNKKQKQKKEKKNGSGIYEQNMILGNDTSEGKRPIDEHVRNKKTTFERQKKIKDKKSKIEK